MKEKVLKALGLSAAFVAACCVVVALGISQSTNTVWNITDSTGTNDIVQLDKSGTLRVQGGIQVFSTTALVVSASGVAAPTNVAVMGLRIRVNGTNYVIPLHLN